jgi:FAD/FMN-containing dehydrogenase
MEMKALVSRAGHPVAKEAIAAFASDLAGRVIGPEDADYDQGRRIWNAMIERHPGLIVRCRGVADVIQSIKFAAEHDLLVAVRGGGHNVAGRALCNGGLVIDLSEMRGVFVDPTERLVRAQGGATLGDVDRETHLHGLAVPLGVVSKTGIAGLTLGGGVGWLVRRYGPTCDNVVAFEVVSASGELMTVSANQNPDLFWALRGGGGNFGVVTSFTYRAYPISTITGGLLVYPREMAVAVLRNYRDYIATAPDTVTAYAAMLTTPDGMPAIAVVACHSGDPDDAQRDLAPLRNFGSPIVDAIQPMPFPAMQKLLDGAFPDGTRNYWKSAFINDLSDAAIDVLVAQASAMLSPLSSIVIEYYCGAAGRNGEASSAFGHRSKEFDVGLMPQWTDPAEDRLHMDWARSASDALEPFANGGYYANFLADERPDVVRAAFGENYDRLAKIKATYDPKNFFSQNLNISPAT